MLRTERDFERQSRRKLYSPTTEVLPSRPAMLNEEVNEIFRMLRTGAHFVTRNHQHFPNASHGNVTLRGIGEHKSTRFSGCSAREHEFLRYKDPKKSKTSSCLERHDFSVSKLTNFQDVPHENAIFENRGVTNSVTDPYSKTNFTGE